MDPFGVLNAPLYPVKAGYWVWCNHGMSINGIPFGPLGVRLLVASRACPDHSLIHPMPIYTILVCIGVNKSVPSGHVLAKRVVMG